MKTTQYFLVSITLAGALLCAVTARAASTGGYNLLPNSDFSKVRSGYWPDWWNWYAGLGDPRFNLDECLQRVDDHHIAGTHSMKLSDGAGLFSSFLRIVFQQDMPLTLSMWMKSDRPGTKVKLYINQDGWNPVGVAEISVGLDWQRYHLTATPGKKSASQQNFVQMGLVGPGTVWINAPQLEEGSVATAWKPSPKDTAGKADAGEPPAKPKFAIPEIDCAKIETAPAIDGVLDDAAWNAAAATECFMRLDESAPAKYATDAYICRDDTNVYIAFRCHEPEMDKLTVKQTLRDATGVFKDDCVEVFLSANEDGADYLHFAANARGTKVDAKGFTMFFDADWDCATGKGDDFWSAEFRLPFSSLARPLQPGSAWRLNLTRFRARPKEEEYSAWAPVVRTFHDFAHYGSLYGVIAEVGRLADEASPGGRLVTYLDRSFYTTESEGNLFVDAPEGTLVRFSWNGSERREKLPASRLLPIELKGTADGKHAITVSVNGRDAEVILKKLPPSEGAVKIDRINRMLLVNDKPFIPVGTTGSRAKTIRELEEIGFNGSIANMHEAFTQKAQERMRGALDAAQACGLKITVWYFNYALTDDHDKWQAELLEMVAMFKDHPAVLAWLVFDEPTSNIKWLAGLCNAVREVDPYHPVFVNWCDRGHGWTRDMGDVTGDVNSLDGYYINAYDYTPREAFLKIGGHCTEMTADAKSRGNVVAYINGIYGWASAIREPSPLENRFVTYVSLIRGARMLLYYNWLPPANPALTESFGPLCREMETLAPVLANPEVKARVSCDNERIDYTAFETSEALYVITLNTDENLERAAFRIDGVEGQATVLFEDRTQSLQRGSLQDTFKPLERHVYRIEQQP